MVEIKRSGSQPSGKGPADYFTGAVRIDPLNNPPEPARVSMALVTFEAGARTAWRAHRLAHASAWADPDRHFRMWLGSARRRSDRGNPPG
jgi:quercetin dioxygenase-like cupin family protein